MKRKIKQLKKVVYSFGLAIFATSSYGQFHQCELNDSIINNEKALCESQETVHLNCAHEGYYESSNNADYIPSPNDPIKTIRLQLHIIQKSDGSDNFNENDPTHMAHLNAIEGSLNDRAANIAQPLAGGPAPNAGYIQDSRLRFKVIGIHFWQDDTGWTNNGSSCNSYCFNNFAVDPEHSLNIFFYGQSGGSSFGGCGPGLIGECTNFVAMQNLYTKFQENPPTSSNTIGGAPWVTMPLIFHEIGHCLGLKHSWSSNSQFPDKPYETQCNFSNPNTVPNCSNNIMGYSMDKHYLSPQQIGHIHQLLAGGWRGKLLESCTFDDNETIEINNSSTTTWDFAKVLGGNLVIKNNSTLVVKCKVSMPESGRVIVEPGSKLIVDGGAFGNNCDAMWQGIEVQGNRFANQYGSSQAQVILKNNATIEYAIIGISTKKYTQNGWDYNSTGGIITATDAKFINNKRDVEFLSYHRHPSTNNPLFEASNLSRFTNCQFEINDTYPLGFDVHPNVTLWDVNGVKFYQGNTFVDNRSSVSGERREGIVSIDASYLVNNNNFVDLEYGIKAYESDDFYGLNNSKYISIKGTNFDCLRGIYFNGLDKSKVLNNIFTTDNTGYTNTSSSLYGIYLDYCNDYEIEENTFTSNANINGGFTWGILVANHHGNPEEIYKNTINGHPVGIEAIDQNKSELIGIKSGLEIRCNDFSNTMADIFVANGGGINIPIKGISPFQGTPNQLNGLADNLFAISSPNLVKNYGNENDDITYFHHPISQSNRLFPSANYYDVAKITPIDIQNNSNFIANCPSNQNITVGGIISGNFASILLARTSAISDLKTAKSTYESLIDGGETAKLESDIQNTSDADAYNHYLELMDKAGYLSEEVLLEVAKKEEGFTFAMIRNILVANPQVSKIKELDEVLDNRTNQLPSYMRNQIRLGKTSLSTKEFLELEIIKCRKHLDELIQEGLELIDIDSSILYTDNTNLTNFMSGTGELKYELKKLKIYANQSDINKMEDIRSNISNSFKLTAQEEEYIESMFELVNLKNTWLNKGYQLDQLPQEELESLEALAYSNKLNSSNAMSILALNNLLNYNEPVYLPEMTKSLLINSKEEINYDEFMLIYPNPTSDFISVRYTYLEPFNNLKLTVNDVQGKIVYSKILIENENEILVPLKDISNGNYIVNISTEEKIVFSDKIIKK